MASTLSLFSSSKSDETPANSGEPKPKLRRGSRPPAAKKTPQRGLGVAQLERLRLQEKWKMMNETIEPNVSLPIYDIPMQPQKFPAFFYLPRCRSGIQIAGGCYGGFPASFQFAAGGNPALELPSNQNSPFCFSNQCEFCVRKKRLFGENTGMSSGADFIDKNLNFDEGMIGGDCRSPRRLKSARESELKEFDFFPRSINLTADEQSEFAGVSAGDGCSPSFIDLSLTL